MSRNDETDAAWARRGRLQRRGAVVLLVLVIAVVVLRLVAAGRPAPVPAVHGPPAPAFALLSPRG